MHDLERPRPPAPLPDDGAPDQPGEARVAAADPTGAGAAPTVDAPVGPPVDSPAELKFQSCRWRKAATGPTPAYCGHPEVHPFAGTNGFVADAWCPDCAFYKLRRIPPKREQY